MASSIAERPVDYDPRIESAIIEIERAIGDESATGRAKAILLLQGDEELAKELPHTVAPQIDRIRADLDMPADWIIAQARQAWAKSVSDGIAIGTEERKQRTFADWLGRVCMHPIYGLPFLFAALYFGLYQFVGIFGAGTVVELIESGLFGEYVNPWVSGWVERLIPFAPIQELLVGEYGVWTLGVTYAIALVLPIVTFFFLVFALLEDSGYLPRLALLIDRAFKKMGLNGRAVIPIVLGFGCDTMATVVTRVLETRRERVITTMLLSLTIPCSAQLGVVLALLSKHPTGLAIWAGVLCLVFLFAGFLAAKALPGQSAPFYMDIPPMRFPNIGNVIAKTLSRLQWYFMEVFPLFVIASAVVWLGQIIGLFDLAIAAIQPLVRLLELPSEAAVAFLFGFFRRDYGAAGLFQLQENNLLTGNQLLVASITLTLFVPCIAQFLITFRERGSKMAFGMLAFTLLIAVAVGWLTSIALNALGITV
ncbi:MAG: ferrous iron transporter B [Armatimonadetes bacterium]|nr:ferrous iron transporter B [Armatimonadota bacterium]